MPLLPSPFPSPRLPPSHHLRLVSPEPALNLSSLSLSPPFSLLLLLSSLSPHPTPPLPSRSLPAVSHFPFLFFLPGISLSLSRCKSVSFSCGAIQRAISLGRPGLTSQTPSLLQGTKKSEEEEEKSQTNTGFKLKDGDNAQVGIFTLR